MRQNWTTKLSALALGLAFAGAPATAHAAVCGDLNNDGNVSVVDVLRMANCVAGLCTEASECGGAGLANCGDTYGDGSVGIAQTDDLNQLVFAVADLEPLHDLCAPVGTPVNCPGGMLTLNSQTITTSQVWPASCTISLNGTVFIEPVINGPTPVLTIESGSTVLGVKGTVDPAALIFMPGSKINAVGTPAAPIVFTSNQADEGRANGDWSGVMFNGRSSVNRPNCQNSAEGVPTAYGGCDVTDSTGVAQYVRVEFAGRVFGPTNELNVWTMNALGSGTDFSYIHAHMGKDDCFEWFGGTNHMHHLVASACADDMFDYQLGYTGSLQFGVAVQNGSTTDAGLRDSRGIEGDNSEFGNNDLPRSAPKFCNLTLVGSRAQSAYPDNGGTDAGILLRRGTAGNISNVIVTGFQDAGAELRDVSTTQVACVSTTELTGDLLVQSGIFFENGDFPGAGTEHAKSGTIVGGNCSPSEWYGLLPTVTANGSNPVNPNVSDEWPASDAALFDARPSAAIVGAPAATNCTLIDDEFVAAPYLGAMDPAGPAFGYISAPWNSFDID